MKTKVFISYSTDDYNKATLIKKYLYTHPYFEAIVIEDERNANIPLSTLITEGILSSFCIIPILSPTSVNTQWINQEIGYAKCANIHIFPIVEISILDDLKGFVNKQNQCPYLYSRRPGDLAKEKREFIAAFKQLIDDLELKYMSDKLNYMRPVKRGAFKFLSYFF
jgi:hypothetical protein